MSTTLSTVTRPVITLKKFHFSAQLSEETNAYTAIVCIDGKPVFTAENHGTGGPDNYSPITFDEKGRKTMDEAMTRLKEYCRTLPASWKNDHSNIECLIGDVISDELEKKDRARFTRRLKTHILYFKPGDKEMWEVRIAVQMPSGAHLAALKKKYPDGIFLNELPADEAWAKAHDFFAPKRGIRFEDRTKPWSPEDDE